MCSSDLVDRDPTLYSFAIDSDAAINIRWRHEYALTVNQDFSRTKSPELDPTGNPWAGPLTSSASGNPTPDSTKTHWIPKGEEVIAQIDGQVVDFSRAGLDIRHVPISYVARGAARGVYSELDSYTKNYVRSWQDYSSRGLSLPWSVWGKEY